MYADPALTFLALVLSWGGDGYCNVHWKRSDGTWAGQAFKDLDAMLRLMRWLQRQRVDVYVCMSSQRVATEKVGNYGPYWRAERHVADAVELKSLFIDIDVKPGAYASTAEAVDALQAFLAATGMPRPMLMVASGGGGLHVHWLFHPALPPDLWLLLAKALKNACKQHGLITDEGVTTDAARILRVPGTLNFKYTPPRPVEFHGDVLWNNYPAEYLEGVLAPYRVVATVLTPIITSSTVTSGVITPAGPNNDLTAGLFVFAWFESAAVHVASLSRSPWELETGGAGQYDDWLDFMFACAHVEAVHPHHAADVRKLFADVMAKVGRIPERNSGPYEQALARTRERIKAGVAGQAVVTPGTVFKFAEKHGWPPPWACANGRAGCGPLDHKQEHALKVAKQRLGDAFLIAQKVGHHRIRGDLVREARLVRDDAVRARLMFALAADLRKSGHADPEIIDTIIACGPTKDHAVFVVAWAAKKNIERGDAA